jgi:hypothetical protein
MFQQRGKSMPKGTLWRCDGLPQETVNDIRNRIGSVEAQVDTTFGESRHWYLFPLNAELDFGQTYYFELSAPEGWDGWRIGVAYGWYGSRYDVSRSGYRDRRLMKVSDLPFRLIVCDVYSAKWR